jgi:hypothetical protein
MKSKIRFNLYRFQIIPKDRHFQGNLFDDINTIEDLINKKNEIFFRVIKNLGQLKRKSRLIKTSIVFQSDETIIYKFAPKKHITVETKDFKDEKVEDWPSFHVFFWNKPDKQLIAIEEKTKAFQKTTTVNNILMEYVNEKLEEKNLTLFSEPIFQKEDFWNIILAHKQKILDIKFDLITPNMSNISHVLSEDLKSLAKDTNTQKTSLHLFANKHTTLDIDESNSYIDDIASYASRGGGNISIKIKGLKKRKHTSDSIETLEIDDIELNSKESVEAFKHLFNDII